MSTHDCPPWAYQDGDEQCRACGKHGDELDPGFEPDPAALPPGAER